MYRNFLKSHVASETKNFYDAKTYCNGLGKKLPVPTCAEFTQKIESAVGVTLSGNTWLGISDEGQGLLNDFYHEFLIECCTLFGEKQPKLSQ